METENFEINHNSDSTIDAIPCPLPILKKNENKNIRESIDDIVDYSWEQFPKSSSTRVWEDIEGQPDEILLLDDRWSITSDISHKHYPYNASGRLFSSYQGKNYSCSASLIGEGFVLTAGHCVSPGKSNDVHENIIFSPNFPKHTLNVQAEKAFIMDGWTKLGLFQFDLAILKLKTPISNTGYHGVVVDIPWGAKPRSQYSHYGWWGCSYPAQVPFNGNNQIVDGGPPAYSPFTFHGDGHFWDGTYEAQNKNDLTGGSSGGPMLINPSNNLPKKIILNGFNPNSQFSRIQYINGVNSFKYHRWPKIMMTPYFGDKVRRFIIDVISANI
ncbi:trypsin-like serine peptidase [Poritiphilus flavus]|uniref:Trypsin-like serine protease n=1 Tax=Poritiphilus flavus TaxID=2697053 RepID=A0A6L9E792_9FLAO|nr:trypsin-like serine protease [Poritiphilus flavus]NAS10596.1 trypsin-like serine protease [Poritiphilus flavus]